MTIRAGQPWGEVVTAPPRVTRIGSDQECAAFVAHHLTDEQPAIALTGGDLFRSVGGVPGVDRVAAGAEVVKLPCDVLRVTLVNDVARGSSDGVGSRREVVAVAHVVVRRPLLRSAALGWWRGRVVAAMNAQYLGTWDVAPRAHPNDGRVDVVDVASGMSLRDRLAARRRLPLGQHVPHPCISTRQVRSLTIDLQDGERVWIDGTDAGEALQVEITVDPDHLTVLV